MQYPGEWKEHYDLTASKRRAAVRAGAIEVSPRACRVAGEGSARTAWAEAELAAEPVRLEPLVPLARGLGVPRLKESLRVQMVWHRPALLTTRQDPRSLGGEARVLS